MKPLSKLKQKLVPNILIQIEKAISDALLNKYDSVTYLISDGLLALWIFKILLDRGCSIALGHDEFTNGYKLTIEFEQPK